MAGTYHDYYTVALAPAIAALVAVAGSVLWDRRSSWLARVGLAASMIATAAWAFVLLGRADRAVRDRCSGRCSSSGWSRRLGLLVVHRLPRAAGRRGARAGPGGRHHRTGGVHGADGGHAAHRVDRDRRAGGGRRLRPGVRRPARRVAVVSAGVAEPADHATPTAYTLGGGDQRRAERGRLPAGHRASGDGDRRVRRRRPEPDPGTVPGPRWPRARPTTTSPAAGNRGRGRPRGAISALT